MADRAPALLRRLRGLASPPADDPAPDAEFLRRFVQNRDGEAFAVLVRRHSDLVLGVCRRTLRDAHRAEDAFQAVWLIFARKAATLRPAEGLAAWLHAVARQVAGNARRGDARRRTREGLAEGASHPPADPLDELTAREFLLILDEEVQRLPEVYRLAVLCCCFEGLSQEEAARRLGWSPGSVKGRLERGRKWLQARLTKRGLTLSTALAAVGMAHGEDKVPAALATATARAALAGSAGEGGAVSAAVIALAVGATPGKFRVALALLVVLGAVTVIAGAVLQPIPEMRRAAEPARAVQRADPQSVPAGKDLHGDPLPDGAVARLGTLRFNHGDGLNALYFLPDGKTILSEGRGSLRLWEAATGKELKHFATARTSFDDHTVLTPDGKTLILLNQENFIPDGGDTVRFWDVARGKETRVVRLFVRRNVSGGHYRNALAPDGRLCALHTDTQVHVFDTGTAKELWKLPRDGDQVRAVTFAGNDRLVTADKKQVLRVWEARTGKLVREFAQDSPVELLVAPDDGRLVATLGHEKHFISNRIPERDVVQVWDVNTGEPLHRLESRPKRRYTNLQFAPDGKGLFTTSRGVDGKSRLSVWNMSTGGRAREVDGVIGKSLAVSPDGRRLVEGDENRFRIWDLNEGRLVSPEGGSLSPYAGVFLTPAGDRARTLGPDSEIHTWDAGTGRHLSADELPAYPAISPERSVSPDGRYALCFAGDFQRVRPLLWDVAAGRLLHTLRHPDADWALTSAFAPDSSLLATGRSGEEAVVYLWDVRTGREVRSFKTTKPGWPGRLFFTGDGQTLFVAGDRMIVGINVADGKEVCAWRPEPLPNRPVKITTSAGKGATYGVFPWRAVAVSPRGTVIALVLGGGELDTGRRKDRIVLCEARTGKVLRQWSDSGQPAPMREQLAFSPDGRHLASSDGDSIHLWEVATGKEVRTFRGHRGDVRSLAFSANGRRLASGSTDTTALLWDLAFPLREGRPAAGPPGEKKLAAWWDDLAGADAGRAYAAVWRLADVPSEAVPFLRRQLKPATELQVTELHQYLADLESTTFSKRERAAQQLQTLGPMATAALNRALEKNPALEVRRRIEHLLEALRDRPASGEWLRQARALAVLEHTGTPAARGLLRELAGGAAGAWLTQEAQAAADRLARRAAP